MAPRAIISYDDTPGDHDALMLGRILADAGASLTLAYVRHTTQTERSQELREEHEAETLLSRGARWLAGLDVDKRVVVSPSTPQGLRRLAEQEEANIIVFGSDYRTASGHVAPQHSAQSLLECGPTAVAIAPADYRSDRAPRIHRIGVLAIAGDDSTLDTARALADSFGATLTRDERQVDLLVVGSRLEAPHGHVLLSARAENEIENATCPVLIVPRGVRIDFPAVLAHAA
ncbi:MAG: universal stress protein [Solirubrobacterales bacterium]|nr:universal stress protein [Solirubrobacterales bacterium]MBV9364689.1 universal stress protein [Solirubrobacterales bacterium]MBV9683584.1 universal stress protein [Solirubrobacterales bacterium]MBV9810344.1 universal stress protein [Solirubrobacterales bacterium]